MLLEEVLPVELLMAAVVRALKSSGIQVSSFMVLMVRARGECLSAILTFIGFGSSMASKMDDEICM